MIEHPPSRRDFLTSAAVAVWIGTDPASLRRALAAMRQAHDRPPQFTVLTPEQAADLEAIASQIVPSDDLPGAREARVIVFIDRALGSHASDMRDPMLTGLDELNASLATSAGGPRRFADLTSDAQIAKLKEIEDTPFFGQVRYATLVGMFAHPSWGGNYEGAGWRLLGFEPRYLWQPPFGAYDAEVPR